MAGGSPVGLVFVEVSMDYTPYTRAQKNLLKSVQSTTLNVEKSYTDLGIKSAKTFDLMRAKIHNAYNRIANDANSSAQEIIRAEQAKIEKLKYLNDQQFGAQTTLIEKLKKNWMAYSVAIYAIQRALRMGWDYAEQSAQYEQSFASFHSMALKMGADAEVIFNRVRELSGNLIDKKSIVESMNRAISLGIPIEKLGDLMSIARAKARDMGITTTQAFNDIATGVGRASPLILDNLGLAIKIGEANETMADSLHKTVAELTNQEKKMAVLNATIAAGSEALDRQDLSIRTTRESMESLRTTISNAKIDFGEVLIRTTMMAAAAFNALASGITSTADTYFVFRAALSLSEKSEKEWLEKHKAAQESAIDLAGKSTEAWKAAFAAMDKLQKETANVAKETARATKETTKATKETDKATDSTKKLKDKVTDLSLELQRAYGNFSAYGDALEDFYTTSSEVQLDTQEKTTDKMLEDYKHFYERVEDYTADTFYRIFTGQLDSFEDFLDEMEDLFLKTLAQLVAKAAAEKITVPIVASVSDAILGTDYGSKLGGGYKFGSGIEGLLGGDFSSSNIFKGLFEGAGAFSLGYSIGSWLKDTFFGGNDEPVYQARYRSGIRYTPDEGFWGNPEAWTSWGDSGAQQIHGAIKQIYTESIATLNKIFGDFSPAVQDAMEPFIQYMQVDMWKNFDYSAATANIQQFADQWEKKISEMFANAMKAEPVQRVLREQLILDIGGSKAPLKYQLNAINSQFDEWLNQLQKLNATTKELTWLEDQRTSALDEATAAMENNIATTEQLASAWEGVAQSIRDQIYGLTTGNLSPLPLQQQMGVTRSAIESIYGSGSFSPDDIGQLQGLYRDLLTQGKQLYSPIDSGQVWRDPSSISGQYEALFNEVVLGLEGLANLAGFAEQEKETNIHLHLYIDGEEIGYTVAKQAKTNPQLIEAIRGMV